jgi:hypothetical protein
VLDISQDVEQVQGDDGTETLGFKGQVQDIAVEEDDMVGDFAVEFGQPGFGQSQQGEGLVQEDYGAAV